MVRLQSSRVEAVTTPAYGKNASGRVDHSLAVLSLAKPLGRSRSSCI